MESLLNINQLAKLLNMSKETIYSWKSKKQLPYVLIGRKLLFRPQDIEQFISKNRINPVD